MPLQLADRVKETTTTIGTGTLSLSGAVAGFRTFVAGVGSTNTCAYCVTDGTDWEVGIGTVISSSPDTLSRTTILSSSNAGSAVNFGAGTKDVFCTSPAAWQLTDGAQTFVGVKTFALGTVTTSQPHTISQTWNSGDVAFTGVSVDITDTASSANSRLIDCSVGGSSRLSVDKYGQIKQAAAVAGGTFGIELGNGISGGGSDHAYLKLKTNWGDLTLKSWGGVFGFQSDITVAGSVNVNSSAFLGLSSGTAYSATADTRLYRGGPNWLALRNATNVQTLEITNSFTSTTDYSSMKLQAMAAASYRIASCRGAGGSIYGFDIGKNDNGTWTNWLAIDTAGKVGIGTTPSQRLDVFGNDAYTYTARIRGYLYGSYGGFKCESADGTAIGYMGAATPWTSPGFYGEPIADGYSMILASSGVYPLILSTGAVVRQRIESNGRITWTGGTQTGLPAGTEFTDYHFNLARTVQFANGAIATQRAVRIQAPVYSHVSGSNTITTAATFAISGPPTTTGGFTTITTPLAVHVETGDVGITDQVLSIVGSLATDAFGGQYSGLSIKKVGATYSSPIRVGAVRIHNSGGYGVGMVSHGMGEQYRDLSLFMEGSQRIRMATNGTWLHTSYPLVWGANNTWNDSITAAIHYEAAGTLAQRNGVNAQTLRVYNLYTDANNFERGIFDWQKTANVLSIGTERAGTGAARDLAFVTDGTTRLTIDKASGLATFTDSVSAPKTNAKGFLFGGDSNWGLTYTFGTWLNINTTSNVSFRIGWDSAAAAGYIIAYPTNIYIMPGASSAGQFARVTGNGVNIPANAAGWAEVCGGNHTNGGVGGKVLIYGGNSNGTNIAGSDITISAGRATGSGTPGALIFQATAAGASGTALQTLATAFTLTNSTTLTFSDGCNIASGTTTGSVLFAAANQKGAFWGATPIVQPTTAVAPASRTGGSGAAILADDTFDGYTIAQVVKALRLAGALA